MLHKFPTGACLTSEKKFDYYDIVEVTKKCLDQVNASYTEIYVTPLRAGYRVEVYPKPTRQLLEMIAHCMSRLLEIGVEVKERPHSAMLEIKEINYSLRY